LNHLCPPGLKFILAAPQLLQRTALAFQFLLCAFQFGDFLLRLGRLHVHFLARRRTQGCAGAGTGGSG
jgi:hypothetical protein